MVLILKGDRGYRGMGMVEAIRKICTSIMSSRLQSSILIHDVLHGFQYGRGTGTSIMEAKLKQQLAGVVNEPLFQFFLDVSND